jgi:hypothetical protein
MSPIRNRLNLLAPVEPTWETAAIEVTFEPGPECAPKFQVFIFGTIYLNISDILNRNNIIIN